MPSILSLFFATSLSCVFFSSPVAAESITFRFEGEYDPGVHSPPEYAIELGAPIVGEFSYDLATLDTGVRDDQGIYSQVKPYHMSFQIGEFIFFQTDHFGYGGYHVLIENDESSTPPTRDAFRIFSIDSALAKSIGMDDVQAILSLQDLTATVFESDALPTELEGFSLDGSGSGWLFFNGKNRALQGRRFFSIDFESNRSNPWRLTH